MASTEVGRALPEHQMASTEVGRALPGLLVASTEVGRGSLSSKSFKILFKILCLAPWLERFSYRFLPDFEAVRPTVWVASLKILQNLIQNPLACAVA
jgi:hypothetical protein